MEHCFPAVLRTRNKQLSMNPPLHQARHEIVIVQKCLSNSEQRTNFPNMSSSVASPHLACILPICIGFPFAAAPDFATLSAAECGWLRLPTEERCVAQTETILIVDDNRDNLEILRTFLESRGYDVVDAADGRTALARVEEIRPVLVLLDVMMPGMDGWQVCRTIKNHPEFGDTRVIMVTAKGGFEDKVEGMRSGADDYIVKPIDLSELAEKVTRNLQASGPDS